MIGPDRARSPVIASDTRRRNCRDPLLERGLGLVAELVAGPVDVGEGLADVAGLFGQAPDDRRRLPRASPTSSIIVAQRDRIELPRL